MMERCAQSLTEEVLSEWDSFPNKVRERLSAALEELQDRLSQVAR
jgi:mRNA-degrading endonuclease RelE of RelBE toxin-antitoxin system